MEDTVDRDVLAADLCEFLEGYAGGLAQTVTLIHTGEAERAARNTAVAAEGLGWIVKGVGLLLGPEHVSSPQVAQLMEAVTESLDHRDQVLTADLIEYRLLPLVLDWRDLLFELRDEEG